jgi:hypothetical protein
MHLVVETSGDSLPRIENRSFPVAGAGSAATVVPEKRTTLPNLILAICCTSLLIVGMDVTIVNVGAAGRNAVVASRRRGGGCIDQPTGWRSSGSGCIGDGGSSEPRE